MKDILEQIDLIIGHYESGAWSSVEHLRALKRELSTNLYYLTKFNISFHEEHNATQYKHKGSVSAGVILANEQYPELRMTRKIMEACKNVLTSMTMELSILNKES